MKDKYKTKAALIEELDELRSRVSELEAAGASPPKEGALPGRESFLYLLDCLPFFAYLQASDYTIRFANRRFRELYGEPGTRPCYSVIWGREAPCDECPTFRVFDTGEPVVWESTHPENGQTYMVYDYPFTDTDGSTLVLEISVDLTCTRRAERACSEVEQRLKTIFESSGDYLMITDTSGVLRYINRTEPGLSEEQVVGRPITDWLPSDYAREVRACLERVADSGEPDTFFTEFVGPENAVRSFEARVAPIVRGGRVEELAILSSDVTGRIQAEQEKERLTEQLLQSQKMEAVGTLAGGIAHDFNNIITVVKTLTDLMLSKVGPDDQLRKYLTPVSESSGRAINLVQQLLIFSRNRPFELESIDANEAASGLMGMFEHLISEDIFIETELSHDLPKVHADIGRLEQLVTNLVINASDAMPQGGKVVITTGHVVLDEKSKLTMPEALPGEYVCLSVSDTGVGIEPDELPHIFEPFYTTKSTAGTGMGLAVVYGIAREHGGWVSVKSEVGEGSTFSVYLPVASDSDEKVVEGMESRSFAHGGGKRILIVEDEKWVRRSTAMVLSEYGYDVFEAANAENAISIFYREKGRFDLVLSDVVMPGRDGLQLVSPLLDINPEIPILLCSGHLDDKAQLSQIVKRGLAYIHKPYEIPDLLAAIEETITEGCF